MADLGRYRQGFSKRTQYKMKVDLKRAAGASHVNIPKLVDLVGSVSLVFSSTLTSISDVHHQLSNFGNNTGVRIFRLTALII
jgi:hypothetical protein